MEATSVFQFRYALNRDIWCRNSRSTELLALYSTMQGPPKKVANYRTFQVRRVTLFDAGIRVRSRGLSARPAPRAPSVPNGARPLGAIIWCNYLIWGLLFSAEGPKWGEGFPRCSPRSPKGCSSSCSFAVGQRTDQDREGRPSVVQ